MSDEDDGNACFIHEFAQQLEDLFLDSGVECRGRFIRNDDVRRSGERDSDNDPLALAAGKLMRVGNYVRVGYGGSGTAARRMSKSSSAAGGVYNILSGGASAEADAADAPSLDVRTLAGLPHSEIAERIADAVNPGDVSLDDAGVREAVAEAVSSVLSENETADITNLPSELIEECYVRTLAVSAFNIIIADIGASLQRAAHGNAGLANDRLKEISDFMREAYRAQYTKFKERGGQVSRRTAKSIAQSVTSQVMDIFESYLE
ncbi:UNVERIFIED_ORG: hypothetical protein J2740_004724 [Rhizobium nepotum]|nr:hypothetical protein [Rhizobium nepotum]